MDNIDKKILVELEKDSRVTNVNLAQKVCLSPSACLRRVQSLEQRNIISQYTTILNRQKLGHKTQIILQITLSDQGYENLEKFEQAIIEIPQVISCILIGGSYDYLVQLLVRDIEDYEELHRTKLSQLPNISSLQSNFTLRQVVKRINPIL